MMSLSIIEQIPVFLAVGAYGAIAIFMNITVLNCADALTWTPQPALVYLVTGTLIASFMMVLEEELPRNTFVQKFALVPQMDLNIIYYFLLPIILFTAAREIDRYAFRKHYVPILLCAIIGTLLTTALLIPVMFCTIKIIYWSTAAPFHPSWLDALLMAIAIAPTDPVSVGSLLSGRHDYFGTLVSGESLLNDGVALVLYSAANLSQSSRGFVGLAFALVMLFVASPIFGYACGYLTVWMINKAEPYHHPHGLENMLILMASFVLFMAWIIFVTGELYLSLSGPLVVVCFGLATNVAFEPAVRRSLDKLGNELVKIVEVVLFAVTGAVLTTKACETNSRNVVSMILLVVPFLLVMILVSRVVVIGILSPFINLDTNQLILFVFVGLKGLISLILASLICNPTTAEHMLLSSSLRIDAASILSITILLNLLIGGILYDWLARCLQTEKTPWNTRYIQWTAKKVDREFEAELARVITDVTISSWLIGRDESYNEYNDPHSRGLEIVLQVILEFVDQESLNYVMSQLLSAVLTAIPSFKDRDFSHQHLTKEDDQIMDVSSLLILANKTLQELNKSVNQGNCISQPLNEPADEATIDQNHSKTSNNIDRYRLAYSWIAAQYASMLDAGIIKPFMFNALSSSINETVEQLDKEHDFSEPLDPWRIEWMLLKKDHIDVHQMCCGSRRLNLHYSFKAHHSRAMYQNLGIICAFLEVHESFLHHSDAWSDALSENLIKRYDAISVDCFNTLVQLRDTCKTSYDIVAFTMVLEKGCRLKLRIVDKYLVDGRLKQHDCYSFKRLLKRCMANIHQLPETTIRQESKLKE